MLFSKLTKEEMESLNRVSGSLGINPEWLYYLVDFESKWNPLAANPYPPYARGLIQFIPDTARELGFVDANDLVAKLPTRIQQLEGPVFKYLKKRAPFPDEQSFTMSVFYPKYRSVPVDTVFPENVLSVNPGIRTPADYIKRVFPNWIPPLSVMALILGAFVFLYISRKGI